MTNPTSDTSRTPNTSPPSITFDAESDAIHCAQTTINTVRKNLVQSDVIENVVENAGGLDAKYSTTLSQSTHLIDAAFVGAAAYTYDTVVVNDDTPTDGDLRVLTAALLLHDVHKYQSEKYGQNADANTRDVLDAYFEHDDFGVQSYLPDNAGQDDLLYLIQRTETGENTDETRGITTDYAGLERYCRIGDAVTSIATRDGIAEAANWLTTHQYSVLDGDHVQYEQFVDLEQPFLSSELMSAVKAEITENGVGVILGGSTNEVLYLGNNVDRDTLQEACRERATESVKTEYEFQCKTGWNKFEYGVLNKLGIPFEEKTKRIVEGYRDVMAGGSTENTFEESAYPDEFDKFLPALVKRLYDDKYKPGDFDSDVINEAFAEVYENSTPQKFKIDLLLHFAHNLDTYRDELEEFREATRPDLRDELEPEHNAIRTAAERFFETGTLETPDYKLDAGAVCFGCGCDTTTKPFKPGDRAIVQSQGFSARTSPRQEYKRVCSVCHLEHELTAHVCREYDLKTDEELKFAVFYFDDFHSDIRLIDTTPGTELTETGVSNDPDIINDPGALPFHIRPFQVDDGDTQLKVVHDVLKAVRDYGMKVMFGDPLSTPRKADAAFHDATPHPQQTRFGLGTVETYEQVRERVELLNVLRDIGQNTGNEKTNWYLSVKEDDLHHLAHAGVRAGFMDDNRFGREPLLNYLKTAHHDEYMELKELARLGHNFYGEQYGSNYKRTKVFRETLNRLVDFQSKGFTGDDLTQSVAGTIHQTVKRMDYAPKPDNDAARDFVEGVQDYLTEHDLNSLEKIVAWENRLVDSYLFAYNEVMNEQQDD